MAIYMKVTGTMGHQMVKVLNYWPMALNTRGHLSMGKRKVQDAATGPTEEFMADNGQMIRSTVLA